MEKEFVPRLPTENGTLITKDFEIDGGDATLRNQHYVEIHHVRIGGACNQKIVGRVQKMI